MVWPTWLAPVLLLLEVMAQPTSVTLDDEGGEEAGLSKPANKKSEYSKLLVEHERISKKQTSTMKHVYSFVTNKDAGKQTPKKKKGESKKKQTDTKSSDSDKKESTGETTLADGEGEEDKQKAKVQPPTPSIPPIPLLQVMMHTETQEACMKLCLQLLGLKSKKGVIDKAHLERVCPSPIVVNGKCPLAEFHVSIHSALCRYSCAPNHFFSYLDPIGQVTSISSTGYFVFEYGWS